MTRDVTLKGGPADGELVQLGRLDRWHYVAVEGGHAVYKVRPDLGGAVGVYQYVREPRRAVTGVLRTAAGRKIR